jgi:hypothetical protein
VRIGGKLEESEAFAAPVVLATAAVAIGVARRVETAAWHAALQFHLDVRVLLFACFYGCPPLKVQGVTLLNQNLCGRKTPFTQSISPAITVGHPLRRWGDCVVGENFLVKPQIQRNSSLNEAASGKEVRLGFGAPRRWCGWRRRQFLLGF